MEDFRKFFLGLAVIAIFSILTGLAVYKATRTVLDNLFEPKTTWIDYSPFEVICKDACPVKLEGYAWTSQADSVNIPFIYAAKVCASRYTFDSLYTNRFQYAEEVMHYLQDSLGVKVYTLHLKILNEPEQNTENVIIIKNGEKS